MTPDERDALYDKAKAAGEDVKQTYAAFIAATTSRALIFRQLRDGGQSLYKMSKRLGLSVSRIGQIVGRADAPDVERRQP